MLLQSSAEKNYDTLFSVGVTQDSKIDKQKKETNIEMANHHGSPNFYDPKNSRSMSNLSTKTGPTNTKSEKREKLTESFTVDLFIGNRTRKVHIIYFLFHLLLGTSVSCCTRNWRSDGRHCSKIKQ